MSRYFVNTVVCLLLLLPNAITAQPYSVNGTVRNAAANTPLSGAQVFVNRTQNIFVTDSTGKFNLTNIQDSIAEVVVTHPGYHSLVYKLSATKSVTSIRFDMLPSTDTSQPDTANRQDMERLFISYFLGMSANARHTYIFNPQVLRYTYNDTTGVLLVTADGMFSVINEALGYMIYYQLESFTLNTKSGWMDLQGYCFYKPLTTQRPIVAQRWAEQRRVAYEGSLLHFMRALYHDDLAKQGFVLKKIRRVTEGEPEYKDAQKSKNLLKAGVVVVNGKEVNFIDVAETEVLPSSTFRSADPSQKAVSFTSAAIFLVQFSTTNSTIASIANINKKNLQSIMVVETKGVVLQKSGLFYDAIDLYIEGALRERLGELLPADYIP